MLLSVATESNKLETIKKIISVFILLLFLCFSSTVVYAFTLPMDRDPKHNWSINPERTWSINPERTWSINPKHTWSVNPKHTWSINPERTRSINPKYTTLNQNLLFYVFNVKGELLGRTLIVSKEVMLFFDLNDDFKGYYVSNNNGGYNFFDADNDEWKGYIISNGQKGFNIFSLDADWVGYMN